MSGLPQGWAEATLGDFIATLRTGPFGSSVHKTDYIEGGRPLINPMHINGGKIVPSPNVTVSDAKARQLSEFAMEPGDIIIGRRGEMGRCAVITAEQEGWLIGTGSMAIKTAHGLSADFLQRFLSSPSAVATLTERSIGSTMVNLNQSILSGLQIAVPPLPEQQRIVAKVDGLTARTARARKELDRIPTLIARYKQRLLALAFSGELTAGWRKANPSLQTALKKVRGNRKADTRLARRKPSASVPEYDIPKTWDWISPDEVAADAKYSIGIGPFGSNLVRTDYRESGVRLVFVRDIRREKFEESDARYIEESKATELHQHIASPGDVLITKMGDPPGDSALFPMDAEPAVITADCIKLTPHGQLATAKFLNFAIRSEIVQSQFKAITAGVAQQKVSLDRFRQLALPIAPLEEQAEIVRRIESAFDWLDRVAADHAAATRLLPKLDAAILAKAFCGELVPQDPNDEPAAKLLERIRRQREAAPKAKRGRKRSSTTIAGSAEGAIEMTGSATAIVGPRKARKSSMAKSRRDDDVWQQPYLAGKLRELRSTDVQALFLVADLPVADFYKQLAWEIDKGLIIDSADELKAA